MVLPLWRLASSVMPLLSFPPAPVSSAWWPSVVPQLVCPWRMVMVGDGSGNSSINKLMWWLDLANQGMISLCSLCSHGGSRGDGGVLVAGFYGSTAASEMGLRHWIRSRVCCSIWNSSSAMCCNRAPAPSAASRFQKLAAGLDYSVVDLSGRRVAFWSASDLKRSLLFFLPALKPDGRQFGNKSASVAPLSGKCWRRSDGDVFAPSGSVPGDEDFGSMLKPCVRWTQLQSTACVLGLFCKVSGLGCNLHFLGG